MIAKLSTAICLFCTSMTVSALSIYECHQCNESQRLKLAHSVASKQCDALYVYLYDTAVPHVWTYRNNETCNDSTRTTHTATPHLTPSVTPSYLQSITKQLTQLESQALNARVDVNLQDWQGEEEHSLHHISEHYLASHPKEEDSFAEFLLELLPNTDNDNAKNLYKFMQITSSITFDKHPLHIEFNVTFPDGSTAIYDINAIGKLPTKRLAQLSLHTRQ